MILYKITETVQGIRVLGADRLLTTGRATGGAGLTVQVTDPAGAALTVYDNDPPTTTVPTPLTSDPATGRVEGWVAQPDYDLHVSGDGTTPYIQKIRTPKALGPPLHTGLDIWEAFDFNNALGNQTDTLTIAKWHAALDNVFDGYGVTRMDETVAAGVATATGDPIVSYTFGNATGAKILITSGFHANESIPFHGGFRFFEAFVKLNTAEMEHLRRYFQITWVACMNPGRFRSTFNTNPDGVNINRNQDFHWAQFDDGGGLGSSYYKGTAASDQPETQVYEAILARGWDFVIDLHDTPGPRADESVVQFSDPSNWVLSSQGVGHLAAAMWDLRYAGDTTLDLGDGARDIVGGYYKNGDPFPNAINRAGYVLAIDQGRVNAGAMLIEATRSALDCVPRVSTTKPMLKRYCGLIHCALMAWLWQSQFPPQPREFRMTARRFTPDYTTSITAGGSKLDVSPGVGAGAEVVWDGIRPTATGKAFFTLDTKLILPRPCYGQYDVRWSGYLYGKGTAQSVDTYLRVNGTRDSDSYNGCGIDATTDRRFNFAHEHAIDVTPSKDAVIEIELGFERTQTLGPPDLRRARMSARMIADLYGGYYVMPRPGNVDWGLT